LDNLKNPKHRETSGSKSLLIRDANIWTGNRAIRGSILLEDGRVKKIARKIPVLADEEILARWLLALPGMIDAHVHLRDMKLSYKEDFTTGTAAAAAGGFTTVLDMPNTLPPTDSPQRVFEKARRASQRILVNVGFHGAAVTNPREVKRMKMLGVFSAKLYLPKPIAPIDVADDREIVKVLEAAKQAALPVTVHAEDAGSFSNTEKAHSTRQMVESRPGEAETKAIDRILRLNSGIKCQVHFCHVTLPTSISVISKADSKRLSSEVTPHHTLLSDESVEKLGWKAWMVPPLRNPAIKRGLFSAMTRGDVTILATDHAPHTIEEKRWPPSKSPPGVPGLETALPLMLTLIGKGNLSLRRLVDLFSANPARVFGLSSKGRLEEGADADIVLVDLKTKGKIDPEKFFSKAHYSPFANWKTQGMVRTTIVNGRVVYQDGEIVGAPGDGNVLSPGCSE
jgi:dihydroorotase